jgi:hypothetical protein
MPFFGVSGSRQTAPSVLGAVACRAHVRVPAGHMLLLRAAHVRLHAGGIGGEAAPARPPAG